MPIRKKALTKKQKLFLEAFEKTAGNVSTACKAVNIGRTTYYDWLHATNKNDLHSPNTFKQKIDEARESFVDFVESALYKGIKDGNTAMIIFYLKTKGKSRGYIETTEQVVEAKVSRNIDTSKLSVEELRVLSKLDA